MHQENNDDFLCVVVQGVNNTELINKKDYKSKVYFLIFFNLFICVVRSAILIKL